MANDEEAGEDYPDAEGSRSAPFRDISAVATTPQASSFACHGEQQPHDNSTMDSVRDDDDKLADVAEDSGGDDIDVDNLPDLRSKRSRSRAPISHSRRLPPCHPPPESVRAQSATAVSRAAARASHRRRRNDAKPPVKPGRGSSKRRVSYSSPTATVRTPGHNAGASARRDTTPSGRRPRPASAGPTRRARPTTPQRVTFTTTASTPSEANQSVSSKQPRKSVLRRRPRSAGTRRRPSRASGSPGARTTRDAHLTRDGSAPPEHGARVPPALTAIREDQDASEGVRRPGMPPRPQSAPRRQARRRRSAGTRGDSVPEFHAAVSAGARVAAQRNRPPLRQSKVVDLHRSSSSKGRSVNSMSLASRGEGRELGASIDPRQQRREREIALALRSGGHVRAPPPLGLPPENLRKQQQQARLKAERMLLLAELYNESGVRRSDGPDHQSSMFRNVDSSTRGGTSRTSHGGGEGQMSPSLYHSCPSFAACSEWPPSPSPLPSGQETVGWGVGPSSSSHPQPAVHASQLRPSSPHRDKNRTGEAILEKGCRQSPTLVPLEKDEAPEQPEQQRPGLIASVAESSKPDMTIPSVTSARFRTHKPATALVWDRDGEKAQETSNRNRALGSSLSHCERTPGVKPGSYPRPSAGAPTPGVFFHSHYLELRDPERNPPSAMVWSRPALLEADRVNGAAARQEMAVGVDGAAGDSPSHLETASSNQRSLAPAIPHSKALRRPPPRL